MKYLTGLICLFVAVACTPEGTPDRRLSDVRDLAEARYGGNAPGGAILVMERGTVLMSEGFGLADLEWQQPAGADTTFRIGSISKIFAAIALLQLAEAGEVELDAPLGTYLDDLPELLAQPTLRQVLSHTSGLGDHFSLPVIPEIMRNPITPEGITALMADQTLMFEPGTRWGYSNFGYVLLGRVISAVDPERREFGRYIEEELFTPLGMDDSHFDRQSAIIPRRARGYDLGPDGPVNTITFDTSLADAAGALMTSADDMAVFTHALLGGELLSGDMQALAWTSVALPDGSDTQYGLGFNVSDFMGEQLIWHSGSINGFQATWAYQPGTERAVAVFSNGYYRANTTDTLRRILAIMAGRPAPEFTEQPFDETQWADMQGRYRLDDGEVLQFHIQDGIRFNIGGGHWRELAHGGNGLFFSPDTLRHFVVSADFASVTYVTTTLDRQDANRIDGGIEGAQVSLPLNPQETAQVIGDWTLGSGDIVAITQQADQLFLALPYQPPQRVFRAAPWEYFSRTAPISLQFTEGSPAATLNLYGNEMMLERQGG